jgi:hypothetical protein
MSISPKRLYGVEANDLWNWNDNNKKRAGLLPTLNFILMRVVNTSVTSQASKLQSLRFCRRVTKEDVSLVKLTAESTSDLSL